MRAEREDGRREKSAPDVSRPSERKFAHSCGAKTRNARIYKGLVENKMGAC